MNDAAWMVIFLVALCSAMYHRENGTKFYRCLRSLVSSSLACLIAVGLYIVVMWAVFGGLVLVFIILRGR